MNPSPGAAPTALLSHQITGSRRAWALAGVMLVMFISVLASTIVANSAPTMVDELHGVNLYAWVFASFTLAATICVPVVGKLSDLLGRRIFYLIGLVAFIAGSVGCAAAQNMPELIAGRVVTGAGGGAMLALTGATIGDIFPPRERAKWMGLIMTNYGIGSMMGPIVGGVIADQFGWRWTFLVTVPLAVLALFVLGAVLPRVRRPGKPTVDWLGIALLSLGLLGALIALTVGGVSLPWLSAQVIVTGLFGVVMLAVFAAHQLRTREPLMSPHLFRNSVFLHAVGLSFLIRMVFFGLLTFFPLYLQGVRGETAQDAGLQLLPLMAAFVVGNVVSGQTISRTGHYHWNAVIGPVIVVAGMAVAVTLTPASSLASAYGAMALLGLGVGTVFPLASTVVQSAFPYSMLGAANSSRQFFDNLGQVIGISVMTTLTIGRFTSELASRLPASAAVSHAVDRGATQGLLSSRGQAALASTLDHLPGGVVSGASRLLHDSLGAGLDAAFWFGLVVAVLAVAVGSRLPEMPLRTTHD
ncbi:MAG TPA: MDR family MFS transporter [Candidatus Dormibacteraeota bacterium]|nr:MDR family MFS transporter [Candidatus Dormibacteraeota bacterium]